ncbi:MAG: 3-deoxy-manno-octulosonate cytidylyltransferase [marine bacterium B5-7]|nr:MAG: 3-deoxy-manno-octulosonate cytidylyltransferase [marine bacterium B5-7]
MTDFDIIIPARYASSRLPGKPLRDVAGKTLLQRVYECASRSRASNILIATDDDAIRHVCEKFGANVVMTSPDHESGTDRLAEVVTRKGIEDHRIVVNLQGDEPLVPEQLIHQVADGLADDPDAAIATVSKEIRSQRDYTDSSVVKVVTDRHGYAMYFSRAPIPWARDDSGLASRWPNKPARVYQHIGMYAYRAGYLKRFASEPPTDLEKVEKLEQLRALYNGERIRVLKASCLPGPGVDTIHDLESVIRIFERQPE